MWLATLMVLLVFLIPVSALIFVLTSQIPGSRAELYKFSVEAAALRLRRYLNGGS
jgi:hypothetical protein